MRNASLPEPPDPADINIIALVKDTERYIFICHDDQVKDTLRTLGRFASNKQLSFSWLDAATLSQRIRKGVKQ